MKFFFFYPTVMLKSRRNVFISEFVTLKKKNFIKKKSWQIKKYSTTVKKLERFASIFIE